MMIRWVKGFVDPVNDTHELIRYSIHPCDCTDDSGLA